MVAVNQEPTQRSGPIRSLIKGLLFIIIKPLILLIFFIRRYPLPALIIAIALVGSLFWLNGSAALPFSSSPTSSAAGARVAPELFLTGQKEANANLMWEAMSDELKQGLQQNGQTPERMQQQLDDMRRQGVSYTGFQFIASTPLNDGRSVYLYVVSASNGGQEPFTFTVNSKGKIERIE
jgi:hypothetical protein